MHPWEGKGLKLLKSVWQEVIIQVVNIQQYLPGQQKAAVSKTYIAINKCSTYFRRPRNDLRKTSWVTLGSLLSLLPNCKIPKRVMF